LFKRGTLTKPLILIWDEFDALEQAVIARLVSVFRHIYNTRSVQANTSTAEKDYLLHGMAFIGVRAGVENVKGSPFNVQRGVHIPNLTHSEVVYLFDWYMRESGQSIESEVVERIWSELNVALRSYLLKRLMRQIANGLKSITHQGMSLCILSLCRREVF